MQDIKTEDLDNVTGGTTQGPGLVPPAGLGSSSSSTGTTNDALLTSLNSIGSSIKDLSSKNNNQGLFGGNGMLFLGMALAMRGRSDNTVYVNGGGGGGCCGHSGGGFSFHARW
jgi:hypothetical protein